MPVYSHSRLGTFEQCKLKFKYKYIDKIETEVENTVEAFMGSRVHDVLEKLYKDLKFSKMNRVQELIDYYNSEWEKNWSEGIKIVRKEYTADNYRKMGEQFIREYFKRYFPFSQGKTIGLEKQIMLKVGPFMIQGFIDRLSALSNGVYEIHDYKTGNSLPTQEEVDKDRQLALYALAVREMFADCKEVKLVWHFLAFDKELRSERSESDLAGLKEEIQELIRVVEQTKEFPPTQSALCDWCEFQALCPVWKHKFELEQKTIEDYKEDSGLKLVEEYTKLKKESDEINAKLEMVKEALVEYAEREGMQNIYGSENIAFVKKYPKMSFPKKGEYLREEFEDTLKKLGVWDKVATVDVYDLTKMINNGELHKELVQVLEKFITKGSNNYVRLRKK